MKLRNLFLTLALILPFTACVDEDPTDVGDALLSGHDVLTFEVVLPASGFLVNDTSFSGYVRPAQSLFSVVANKFENVVDANTLVRYSLPPRTIIVRTTGTTLVTDSFPIFASGRLVLKMDTIATTARPVSLRLFRTAEQWNESATWINRVDTGTVQLPWSTPGGTRGSQIDTATWVDTDSVVFHVDSATLALWNDSTNNARGAILVTETQGSRVRVVSTSVHISATSTLRADTVVNVDIVPTIRTFVYNPVLATPFSGVRAGGINAWRSFLRMRPDLRSLTFPCPGGPVGCTVSLDSAHVNIAELQLRPVTSPPGFSLEDSTFIEVRTITVNSQIPLERSPIGERIAVTEQLGPNLFRNPDNNTLVRLNITSFIVHLLDESITDANRLSPILSVLQLPEGGSFGFASFDEPRLRLVLTTRLGSSR